MIGRAAQPVTGIRAAAAIVLLVAGASQLGAAGKEGELVTLDGRKRPALLQSIQDEKFEFLIDGRPETVAVADLVVWGVPRDAGSQVRFEPTEGAQIALADGGLLVADILDCDGEDVIVESQLLGRLKLPLGRVAVILFRPPGEASLRDERLAFLLRQPGGKENDGLLLENNDLIWGTLKTIQRGKIEFFSQGITSTIESRKVAALSVNAALQSKARERGLRWIVGLDDGSHVRASLLAAKDGNLEITTLAGTWSAKLARVVYLQTLGGSAVYLSDLKPADYRHIPYLTMSWNYHLDRNVLGLPLRSGGRQYFKGIGMHSTSRLTFDLDASYRKLEGSVALDDSAGTEGNVTFRVFADTKEVFRSEPVSGGPKATPIPFSVQIGGAQRISLVVDFGQRGDVLDRANWLDLRLMK